MSTSLNGALHRAKIFLQLFEAYDTHPGYGDDAFWEVFGDIEPGELHYMMKQIVVYLEDQA